MDGSGRRQFRNRENKPIRGMVVVRRDRRARTPSGPHLVRHTSRQIRERQVRRAVLSRDGRGAQKKRKNKAIREMRGAPPPRPQRARLSPVRHSGPNSKSDRMRRPPSLANERGNKKETRKPTNSQAKPRVVLRLCEGPRAAPTQNQGQKQTHYWPNKPTTVDIEARRFAQGDRSRMLAADFTKRSQITLKK